MSDPKDYTLVRMDDDIKDKAVLTYDVLRDTITDSGLTAENGELQASADSIIVGLQSMSSAGEQVVWENAHSSVTYAPPWHIIDKVNDEGSRDRIYGALQTNSPFTDKSGVLENPSFAITVPENGVVFDYTIEVPEARKDIVITLDYDKPDPINPPTHHAWREIVDISAGVTTIDLKIPNALYTGSYWLSAHPLDSNQSPFRVMGNPATGEAAYSVSYRNFREVPLATKEYVADYVSTHGGSGGGPGGGDMLKSVYDTDDDGKVNLAVAADYAAALTGVQDIGTLHYYGKDANGNVGFHSLPTNAGNSGDLFSSLKEGEIPLWDAADKKMVPSGIRKVAGQVLAEPSGIYLGDVSVSTDGHGMLLSPVGDPKTYKVLTQAITANSDTAYVRTYGNPQEKVIHSGYATQIENPIVSFSSNKDVTIVSMAIRSSEVIKELIINFRNADGENIWSESFFNLEAGSNTLTLATPPDVLSGETVTLAFSGKDHADNPIKMDGTDSTPYLKLYLMGWVENKIATEEYVTSGVGGLENKVDDTEVKVDDLETKLASLSNKLGQVHNYYVYRGKETPTFPDGVFAGYFGSLYALSKRAIITLPNPDGIRDGTHFFLRNEDKDNSVRIEASTGVTVKGGTAINIPPQNTLWLVRSGNDWLELLSGYMPSSYTSFLSDISAYLSKDKTFLKSLKLQGDDPNAAPLEVNTVAFHKCDVEHDPNDPKRATISPRLGLDFINPDNTRINKVTEVRLVGMEIKDTGDGTPPKLILLDHNGVPTPSTASAYAFFNPKATPPDSVTFQSLPVFRGGRVTVHKDTTDPEYAYILIPPGEDTDTERVGELGGIPSYWSKQSKEYTIGGQQRTYTVFRSPYRFHETDVTLVIYP